MYSIAKHLNVFMVFLFCHENKVWWYWVLFDIPAPPKILRNRNIWRSIHQHTVVLVVPVLVNQGLVSLLRNTSSTVATDTGTFYTLCIVDQRESWAVSRLPLIFCCV